MLPSVLFEHDVIFFHQIEQALVVLQCCLFVSQGFPEDVADVVFLGFEERSNAEGRMGPELRDEFTCRPGMRQ
jgi:hypothetical protein